MFVKSLQVFGSYLGRSNSLGDLDLAIELAPRAHGLTDEEWTRWLCDYGYAYAPANASYVDLLGWPELSVRRKLKARSPFVSLHTLSELEQLSTRSSLVFKAEVVAPPRPTGQRQ